MNTHHFKTKYFQLKLAIVVSVFIAGCATQPSLRSTKSYNIEGKWSWRQDPWHGYFVLQKDGNSYTGTLDDIFEGTYGDRITDVDISDNHIKFTRDGRFGLQYWEGTLVEENGLLKIIDGRWKKERSISGSFSAEKKN
jgi:hypothetical protein